MKTHDFALSLAAGLLAVVASSGQASLPAQADDVREPAAFISEVPGDADCDFTVTPLDALTTAKNLAGTGPASFCMIMGNILCEDGLNSADLAALLRYLADLSPGQPQRCLPAGQPVDFAEIASGTITIPGTWLFDFDSGQVVSGGNSGHDFWWQNAGDDQGHEMTLVPSAGARARVVTEALYGALTMPALNLMPYSSDEIGGPGSPNNQLQDGAVFAMITDQGNYAQAQVITAGADMTIEFITYRLD